MGKGKKGKKVATASAATAAAATSGDDATMVLSHGGGGGGGAVDTATTGTTPPPSPSAAVAAAAAPAALKSTTTTTTTVVMHGQALSSSRPAAALKSNDEDVGVDLMSEQFADVSLSSTLSVPMGGGNEKGEKQEPDLADTEYDESKLNPEEVILLLREKNRRLTEENQRREAARQEQNRRLNAEHRGTFFLAIDQVWKPEDDPYPIFKKDFDKLRRKSVPSFVERRLRKGSSSDASLASPQSSEANQTGEYTRTKQGIYAVREATTSSEDSLSTTQKDHIFGTDIFGQIDDGPEVAHLVPVGPTVACMHTDVVRCVLAIQDKEDKKDVSLLQRAIHGFRSDRTGKREDFTGVKHFISNKIKLDGQARFFDQIGSVVIVPVMKLARALDWDGEGYEAIVLAGPTRKMASAAYRGMNMPFCNDAVDLATGGQVEEARELLKAALRGLYYSLMKHTEVLERGLDEDTINKFKELRRGIGSAKLIVPMAAHADHDSPYNPNDRMKSAANWSKIHKQILLKAAAEPLESEEDTESQLEEESLKSIAAMQDAEQHRDIMRTFSTICIPAKGSLEQGLCPFALTVSRNSQPAYT